MIYQNFTCNNLFHLTYNGEYSRRLYYSDIEEITTECYCHSEAKSQHLSMTCHSVQSEESPARLTPVILIKVKNLAFL